MPLCDEIDPAAEAIGSVNTIVRCADGKLVGYNTDIDGFLYMACRADISLSVSYTHLTLPTKLEV